MDLMGGTRALISCLALGLCLGPGLAAAQSQDEKKAAREAYMRAEAASAQGDHERAVMEFELAYSLTKDPVLFYSIAKAKKAAGDCNDAIIDYNRFLEEAKPAEAHAKLATDAIAECQKVLADAAAAQEPPVEDTPPPDGGAGDTGATDLGSTSSTSTDIYVGTKVEPERSGSWMRTAAWISLGLSVAATGTGFVFGSIARKRQGQIDELFEDPSATFSGDVVPTYGELDRDAYENNNRAWGAFITAGITGAAAVTFFVLDVARSRRQEREAAGTAVIAPVVSGDGVGVTAGWEF